MCALYFDSVFSKIMLFWKVTKELDYENPEVVAAGHIYEMTISVFDDLHPSHTGNRNGLSKAGQCVIKIHHIGGMRQTNGGFHHWEPFALLSST